MNQQDRRKHFLMFMGIVAMPPMLCLLFYWRQLSLNPG